jgi:hypothetical protein
MSKAPAEGMIGPLPSKRGGRPADAGRHAIQIAQEWVDEGESEARRRMRELRMRDLRISEHERGQPDDDGDGRWPAFDAKDRKGRANTTGADVDAVVLNPDRLTGQKGGRIWPRMKLKDRIDSIMGHEYVEFQASGRRADAVKNAARTRLPISDEARRPNRARAR